MEVSTDPADMCDSLLEVHRRFVGSWERRGEHYKNRREEREEEEGNARHSQREVEWRLEVRVGVRARDWERVGREKGKRFAGEESATAFEADRGCSFILFIGGWQGGYASVHNSLRCIFGP